MRNFLVWAEVIVWIVVLWVLVAMAAKGASAKDSPLRAEILWQNIKEGTLAIRIPPKEEFTPVYVEIVFQVVDKRFVGRIGTGGTCDIMQAKNKTFIKVGVLVGKEGSKERMTWVEVGGPVNVTVKEAGSKQ